MRKEPLLLPFVFLAGGVWVVHQFGTPTRPAICSLTVSLLFCLIAAALHRRTRLSLACLCIASFSGGVASAQFAEPGVPPKLDAEDGEIVLLSGCVTNPSVFSPSREQFTLSLTPRAAARITVTLKQGLPLNVSYGRNVEVVAKIRTPRNFGNPEAFDYVSYLAAQHLYWLGSVESPAGVHLLPGSCGSRPIGWLFGIRGWALERIRGLYPDDPKTVGLLQATLLGETAGLERRWTEDFRSTGTYHALVISGQHVSVLAFTLLFLLRLLRMRRLPALGLATVVCWLYAFLAGFSAPVVRAAGGFTLFLVASYLFRRTRILNLLAAIGIVYLAFSPNELFDPSFQLSFLSAAAIAAFAIPMTERWTEPLREAVQNLDQIRYDPQVSERAAAWRVELRLVSRTLAVRLKLRSKATSANVRYPTLLCVFILDAVILSACVQFGLALPLIEYFHRLSFTGLSANVVVVPILSVVIPLGFASIVSGSHLLGDANRVLLLMAQKVASWHTAFEPNWRQGGIPLAVAIGFGLSLVVLAYVVRRRLGSFFHPALATALVLFGVVVYQPWRPLVTPGNLEVTAIDVSQGDSLFVSFPNGRTMLVDAGGFPGVERMVRKPQLDMGEDVVAPYLWSRRVRRLDYVVLTHGHSDHMGGLAAILDDFRPQQLWIGAEPETREWQTVREHARLDGVAILSLTRSSQVPQIGGTRIRVLAPAPDYQPGEAASNDDSLVFEIRYGKRSVLLTGDAERAEESDMVENGKLEPVTLLKVGHHGSRTSSSEDFLSVLEPQFAFISDGYKNQFHHPHPDVLARLGEHHLNVYRTDQRGLVTFRTDGDRVSVTPYR